MRRFLLLLSLTLLLALPAAAQNACTLDITMNCTLPHCAATVVNSGTNTCSGDYYVGFWVVGDQQNTAVVAGIQQNLGVPECFTSSDIPGGVGYGFAFCTGPAALAPGGSFDMSTDIQLNGAPASQIVAITDVLDQATSDSLVLAYVFNNQVQLTCTPVVSIPPITQSGHGTPFPGARSAILQRPSRSTNRRPPTSPRTSAPIRSAAAACSSSTA